MIDSVRPRRSSPARLAPVLVCSALLAQACDQAQPAELDPRAVLATHAELAWRSYGAARDEAVRLQEAIERFVTRPDLEGLEVCRTAWRRAHDAYSPTEVFRFQGGPIDGEGGPETRINAWPLDEQWLDATLDEPGAGLINAADVPLSASVLVEFHEKDGEKNVATGYHALEFLLWGQDRDPAGPGQRPPSDFADGGTAPNPARRREYLRLASALLVRDLEQVVSQWAPGAAYRTAFVARDPAEGLRAIFTGMVMLAGHELSGERLAVAYETQDQEEEQSCFSDNTCADSLGNALGLRMAWSGTLVDVAGAWQGPSLAALVEARSPAAAQALSAAIEASIVAVDSIPAPFDQAVRGDDSAPGRRAVLAAIEALEHQADETVAAARTLGVRLDFGPKD